MRVPGQRSKTVRCLLDAADVQELSDCWDGLVTTDLLVRSDDGVVHPNLAAGLHADGVQVFASRASWASPLVQYLSSQSPSKPHVLLVGRLAYRWVPEDYSGVQQRDFLDLTQSLFRGLRMVANPKRVCLYDGSLVPVLLGRFAEERGRSGRSSLRENAFRYRVVGSPGPGTALDWDDEAQVSADSRGWDQAR